MPRDVRDPQVELIRRYARILRSAPAEAWPTPRTATHAPAAARVTELVQPARFGRTVRTPHTGRKLK
jgi:hypothetical protein